MKQIPSPRFPFTKIDQVCIVVDGLEKTIARYWAVFGIGPWAIYHYHTDDITEANYRGEPGHFGMKVAMAALDNITYEVIEPIEGHSIYTDFLQAHGSGLQHLGIVVPDCAAAVAALKEEGYEVLMSGRGYGSKRDGAFAYMGTDVDLAAVFELVQPPSERRKPVAVYP